MGPPYEMSFESSYYVLIKTIAIIDCLVDLIFFLEGLNLEMVAEIVHGRLWSPNQQLGAHFVGANAT